MDVYKRMLKYLKPYPGKLVLAGICMLGVAGLTAYLAFLVKPALDDIFVEKELRHACVDSCAGRPCLYAEGGLRLRPILSHVLHRPEHYS